MKPFLGEYLMNSKKLPSVVVTMSIVGVLGISSLAEAGTRRDDRADSLFLNLAAQPQFQAVGQIEGDSNEGGYLCSGTLIAPNVIMTAAHCVDIATSLQFLIGGQTYSGADWVFHPNWNPNLLQNGFDIGLIFLNESVVEINPATRYTGISELGQVGIPVGFGLTGTGLTGAVTYDGQKRAGTNILDQITGDRVILADFDQPRRPGQSSLGSSRPTLLEYSIAPGDSGGGTYVNFGGDIGYNVVGIHSFGLGFDGNPDSDYGDQFGVTRVSFFNDWIDSEIANWESRAAFDQSGSATQLVGGQALAFASAIPEPGTMILMGMGAMSISRRRRVAA
jgi:hypothetical protein